MLGDLSSRDPEQVLEFVEALVASTDKSASPQLLELLRTTDDNTVRNKLAVVLSDWEDPHAFDVIVSLLRDEKTKKSRGTLLYALTPYDCSPILPLLVDMVADGNFEVSREALSRICAIDTELSEQTWTACQARIATALPSASDERRPLLLELSAMFEDDSTCS